MTALCELTCTLCGGTIAPGNTFLALVEFRQASIPELLSGKPCERGRVVQSGRVCVECQPED